MKPKKVRGSVFLLIGALFLLTIHAALADDKDKIQAELKPRAKGFSIGADTTFFLGPLTKDGFLDYVHALNERLSRDIKPEENANILLWKIMGPKPEGGRGMSGEYFQWLGMKAPAEEGDYYMRAWHFARDILKIPQGPLMEEFFTQMTDSSARPWKEPQFVNIALCLKQNEKQMVALAEAVKRKKFYNPLVPWKEQNGQPGLLISGLLPNVQFIREFANALSSRAMWHAGEGRVDEAWQDVLTCLRLGRLAGQGGCLIEGLVGTAIESIGQRAAVAVLFETRPGLGKNRTWQRDLGNLPPRADLSDKGNLTERAMFLDCLQHIIHFGPKEVKQVLDINFGGGIQAQELPDKFEPQDWDPAFRLGNRWFNRIVSQMRQEKYPDRLKQWEALDQELKEMKKEAKALFAKGNQSKLNMAEKIGRLTVVALLPAYGKVHGAWARAEQNHANLDLALALKIYHLEKGAYPENLASLAPAFIAKVPEDLFICKPLHYLPRPGGFLLYSVGANGKDDGGLTFGDTPPGDDLAIRSPLPKQ